jgi:hypothetical protein
MSVQLIHQVFPLIGRSCSSRRTVLVAQFSRSGDPHRPRELPEIGIRPVRAVEQPGRHHPVEDIDRLSGPPP